MRGLFIDESGEHSFEHIDDNYPVFVLAGIIIDTDYHKNEVRPIVDQFKREKIGDSSVILRSSDMKANRNGFEFLWDDERRVQFWEDLNELMEGLDYKVVACAVDKYRAAERYENIHQDPYHYCLRVLVELFVMELQDVGDTGIIVPEKRGRAYDVPLENAWKETQLEGTKHFDAESVVRKIVDFMPLEKSLRIPGLEMADLVANPVGRFVIGKKMHRDWDIIVSKFRRHEGRWEGPGLVVLPPT